MAPLSLPVSLRLVLAMASLVACGGPPGPPAALPPTHAHEERDAGPTTEAGAAAAGHRAVFDRLVAEVGSLHVFSAQTAKNLGRRWEDELPALGLEFERADTDVKLSVAIEHFANALHNPHCRFEPKQHGDHVTLGFTVNAEWTMDAVPIFRVWSIEDDALRRSIAEGDVVQSVDGVPAASLVEALAPVSNANNRRGIARDIAHWLTRRSTSRALVTKGQASEWSLSARDGTSSSPKALKAVWKEPEDRAWSDYRLDYEKEGCAGLRPRTYGSDYELLFAGARYCIYASKRTPFRDFPVVRQFSFSYSDSDWEPSPTWLAHADQRNLKSQLASLSPKGVILDLRDNGGGNNPNWFLDWWAPSGWIDARVQMRLEEVLADGAMRERTEVSLGDGNGAWYRAQLAGRAPGQQLTAPRPFFCKPGPASDPGAKDCAWDNRYAPGHRVTTAPVALLVGPGCVSACDSVARAFAENHFGPLVGEPTAAGYTTQRMKLSVTDGGGSQVGAIRIAISNETSGLTGRNIEAVPLHIDYPVDRTFDNRDAYDAALIDAALVGFRKRASARRSAD